MSTVHEATAPREILDVPNIGSRVFRRPGPTIRSAKTGEVVPPEKLAANLVKVAVVEHAVVEPKRWHGMTGQWRACSVCGVVPIFVPKKCGAVRKLCTDCKRAKNLARIKAWQQNNPDKRKRAANKYARAAYRRNPAAAKAAVKKGQNRLRTERKAAGLCVWCGKPRGTDGTTIACRPCAARQSGNSSRTRPARLAAMVAEGRCRGCGKPRGDTGTKTLCRPCAHKACARAAARKARTKKQR